jgi:hypothetical protein
MRLVSLAFGSTEKDNFRMPPDLPNFKVKVKGAPTKITDDMKEEMRSIEAVFSHQRFE